MTAAAGALLTQVTPLAGPNGVNTGLCTLSFQDTVFRFRTNPNEIWWSYELLTNIDETFGGRVIQVLGTRLGDLTVTVECGGGGIDYLMQVVLYLRNLLSDQRNGNTATFGYTTRNWQLNVYALSIPFQDQFDATTREIPLNFKIQQDVNGILSQVTLDANLAMPNDGTLTPGQTPHNQYNDAAAAFGTDNATIPQAPGGPTYLSSGIVNNVDTNPAGTNPGGLNPLASIPFATAIPGVSTLSTLLGGTA
jgi:hypothetical protein